MKRFYKLASVSKTAQGFTILLDGRSVKTKAKKELCAPSEAIAHAIMQEWANQGDKIIPETMPVTQILNTKIDRVSIERDVMTETILKYLNTDLICYHAPEPPELAARQDEIWSHWLGWFKDKFGEELQTTTGLDALTHSALAHQKTLSYIKNIGDDHFTILQLLTAASGSLILALAFVEGEADTDQIFEATRIEEDHKAQIYDAEKYGPDPMQAKKDKAFLRDLTAATLYLKGLKSDQSFKKS